jgi:hypothetical protein
MACRGRRPGAAAKDYPPPPRYLVIRITKKQGRLFAAGGEVKHFAIVTNLPDPPTVAAGSA